MSEMNLENLEKVTGGSVRRFKRIEETLSEEDKKKLKEMEEEIFNK